MVEANRDMIVGIKVRVGRHASGTRASCRSTAMEVAEETGLPLMAHIDEPPPTYAEVLDRLRPGDVLTHAFRPFPNAPCTADGSVRAAVLKARQRGVLFDIGHGMGSFAFKTARTMLANGFARTPSPPTSMRCASTGRPMTSSPPCRNSSAWEWISPPS